MALTGLSPDGILAQLKKLEASVTFYNVPEQRERLRFLVERTLAGEGGNLTGSYVAAQLFGGQEDEMRSAILRLRNKLRDYYDSEGQTDSIRITIPKGSYAAKFSLWESTSVSSNHPCARNDVQLVQTIDSAAITTTTELVIQSLTNRLAKLHHGLVVSEGYQGTDLTTSTVKVESLQETHNVIIEEIFPGLRTFQFAMRVRPTLNRGEVFRYRYTHQCANYYPLSKAEIMNGLRLGGNHPRQFLCEKSYTITTPTRRLSIRIILPKGIPKVLDAKVEAAAWKSDTIDEIENSRLATLQPIQVRRFLDQDHIELSVDNPQLFARYRLFWDYVE